LEKAKYIFPYVEYFIQLLLHSPVDCVKNKRLTCNAQRVY